MRTRIIAFYLPQFHTIPENDEWWGKGFTDWVNVRKAKPIYKGHEQPRVPLNNNYYDLTNPEVIRWQAQLAKDAGIDYAFTTIGSMESYYWKNLRNCY